MMKKGGRGNMKNVFFIGSLTLGVVFSSIFSVGAADKIVELDSDDGSSKWEVQSKQKKGIAHIDSTGDAYFKGNVGISTTTPSAALDIRVKEKAKVHSEPILDGQHSQHPGIKEYALGVNLQPTLSYSGAGNFLAGLRIRPNFLLGGDTKAYGILIEDTDAHAKPAESNASVLLVDHTDNTRVKLISGNNFAGIGTETQHSFDIFTSDRSRMIIERFGLILADNMHITGNVEQTLDILAPSVHIDGETQMYSDKVMIKTYAMDKHGAIGKQKYYDLNKILDVGEVLHIKEVFPKDASKVGGSEVFKIKSIQREKNGDRNIITLDKMALHNFKHIKLFNDHDLFKVSDGLGISRLVVDKIGNVGIGRVAPQEMLHLQNELGNTGMRISGQESHWQYINFGKIVPKEGTTKGYAMGSDNNDKFFINRDEPLGIARTRLMTIGPNGDTEIKGDIFLHGSQGFESKGETAALYFGHPGHSIRGEHGKGVIVSAYGAKDALTVHEMTGNIGIKSVPIWDVDNDNDLTWDGNIISREGSSRRYKQNIQPLQEDFHNVLELEAKQFQMKEGYGEPGKWLFGYIAEDLEESGLSKLVIFDREGRPDGIKYKKFAIYLNEVIKVHEREIKDLQEQNAMLMERIEALEARSNTTYTNSNK